MVEGGLIAVVPEDPEKAVQVPVHHPHGGGGGGGKGVGLHARQHVELRIRRASREAGHRHVAAEGVGVLPEGVEVGQGVVLFCIAEHIRVGDIGERLVHHHDHADGLSLAGLVSGLPGLRHGAAEALGPVHQIGGEVVAEGVGKAQVVEDGGDVLGVADLEGLV